MCILFVKLGGDTGEGAFKLVLASNRDEFFARPATHAHFWREDANILGGQDMTVNKEGGTWLAMSRKGKIGVILNVSEAKPDPEKMGRGFLISEFLKNSNTSSEHLKSLSATGDQYNKFHMVAIDSLTPSLSHYSNGDVSQTVTTIYEGTFALGNTHLTKPYKKVIMGRHRFENVIERFDNANKKDELVSELLDLLKWREKHLEIGPSSLPPSSREFLSSVYIDAPNSPYGTRSHTIILVDRNNKADFYEWTLKEPINPEKKEWIASHHEFQIENKS